MPENSQRSKLSRRKFLKLTAAASLAGQAAIIPAAAKAAGLSGKEKLIRKNERDSMTYKKLGRTNFMSSRLVFGCGAALAGGRAERLLDKAFEAGINHFDVGANIAYRGAERNLADFAKKNRDNIYLVSKAPPMVRADPDTSISVKTAKRAARKWGKMLNQSLKDLKTESVDAYYLMGVSNVELIKSEELYNAFLKAKEAGKVQHFGISTHGNAHECLVAATEAGWYDIAMIGITPSGWYDWDSKELVDDSPTLEELASVLKAARDKGIGLVGMKTVRYLATTWVGGQDDEEAFDDEYDEKFLSSKLSPFQRAFVFALEHGLDVVNADMQNYRHLEENIIAAKTSAQYFG